MTEFWNLVQIGTVYLTNDEMSSGDKAICTVEGMDVFGIGQDGSQSRSLNNVVYTQLQDTNESPVTINIPKMESGLYDAVRDVFTAWTVTPTDFTFAVTGVPDNFTGTAKPRWDNAPPISYTGERVGTQIWGVVIRLWAKD